MLEPNTSHACIWTACAIVQDAGWFELLVRPLYTRNLVCQVGFNTIIPIFTQILLDPTKVNTNVSELPSKTNAKLTSEYDAMMAELQAACEKHEARAAVETITEEMIKMREVLRLFSDNAQVREGLRLLFVTDRLTRTIFGVILPRMTRSLYEDNEITSSNDLPTAFIGL